MTNLEALKGKVEYPLSDNSFKLALIDRGLEETGDYSTSNKKAIELAQADCLVVIITTATIGEEGYSQSHSNKGELRKTASGIYKKWGEPDPFDDTPSIEDATELW